MLDITIPHIVVYGLAVWRISSLFVRERGPVDVFLRLRVLTGITHDDRGTPWVLPETFFAQLLGCVWCFSMYASLGMGLLIFFFPWFALRFAIIFAFSGAAILLDTIIQKSR